MPASKAGSDPAGHTDWLPGIEGSRAVAISLVVAGKYLPDQVACGWLGVDLFFVISGFVITRRILADQAAGRFRLGAFYLDRLRRLGPALFVMLAAVLVAGWFTMLPDEYSSLAVDVAAVATGIGNIRFWLSIDYWRAIVTHPMVHCWSLGVEEQFYLLYPWVLMIVSDHRWRLRILGLGLLLSFVVWYSRFDLHPGSVFYLLPCRAWELLTGALAALIPQGRVRLNRFWREAIAALGLIVILVFACFELPVWAFRGIGNLLVCLAGFALVLTAARPSDSLVGSLLSRQPARWIGRLSYSIYLWYLPILVIYRFDFPVLDVSHGLSLIAATLIAAAASYYLVEQPIRKRVWLKTRPRFLVGTGLAEVLVLVTTGVIFWSAGFAQRFTPEALRYAVNTPSNQAANACWLKASGGDCSVEGPLDALIWGDSYALQLFGAAEDLVRDSRASLAFAFKAGCPPFINVERVDMPVCAQPTEATLRWVLGHHVAVVVLVSAWVFKGLMPIGAAPITGADTNDDLARYGLSNLVGTLHRAGIRVLVVEPEPVYRVSLPRQLTFLATKGKSPEQAAQSRIEAERGLARFRSLTGELAARGEIEIVPLFDLFCDATLCRPDRDGRSLYEDWQHLSPEGAALIAPRIAAAIARSLNRP